MKETSHHNNVLLPVFSPVNICSEAELAQLKKFTTERVVLRPEIVNATETRRDQVIDNLGS